MNYAYDYRTEFENKWEAEKYYEQMQVRQKRSYNWERFREILNTTRYHIRKDM